MVNNKIIIFLLSFFTSFLLSFYYWTYTVGGPYRMEKSILEDSFVNIIHTAFYYIAGPIIHLFSAIYYHRSAEEITWIVFSYTLLVLYIAFFSRLFFKADYYQSKTRYIFKYILMFLGMLAWCSSGIIAMVSFLFTV